MFIFLFCVFFFFLFSQSFADTCNPQNLKIDLLTEFYTCKTDQRLEYLKNYSSVRSWNENNICKLCLEKLQSKHNINTTKSSKMTLQQSNEPQEITNKSIDDKINKQESFKVSNNVNSVGYNDAPADQKFMNNLIYSTKQKMSKNINSAKEKYMWIQASKELCSSTEFDAFAPKKNWVGHVKSVIANDSGEIQIEININDFGNKIWDTNLNSKLIKKALNFKEAGLFNYNLEESTFVKFSGSFKRGKMSENECLDASVFNAEPDLDNQTFFFTIYEIEELR